MLASHAGVNCRLVYTEMPSVQWLHSLPSRPPVSTPLEVIVVDTVVVVVVLGTLRGGVELDMVDVLWVICGGVARNERETTEWCTETAAWRSERQRQCAEEG